MRSAATAPCWCVPSTPPVWPTLSPRAFEPAAASSRGRLKRRLGTMPALTSAKLMATWTTSPRRRAPSASRRSCTTTRASSGPASPQACGSPSRRRPTCSGAQACGCWTRSCWLWGLTKPTSTALWTRVVQATMTRGPPMPPARRGRASCTLAVRRELPASRPRASRSARRRIRRYECGSTPTVSQAAGIATTLCSPSRPAARQSGWRCAHLSTGAPSLPSRA